MSPASDQERASLAQHAAFKRVFTPGRLTFGLIAPLEAYPDTPFPTLKDHERMAKMIDDAGFASMWLRDVPFYDPNFGDVGQMLDPFVYAGFLASVTSRISIGTAGIVLPLRDPIIVAKQAASVDQLSGGRFILGLSTGDRPSEYPAFGADFDNREERYREAFKLIRSVSEQKFPKLDTRHYGMLHGELDLVPKPVGARMPMIAVGRSRQPLEWLAQNVDAWIWSVDDANAISQILDSLRVNAGAAPPPAYGYATFFDLAKDPDAPPKRFYNVVRIGRKALIERWYQQQELGVTHVALNMKPSQRSAEDVIAEMAEHVLPLFGGSVQAPADA
ncbi:TIGR03571 family LLM class oxidoreductase [Pseudoduganella sp. FT25W]|uniref:TIGR03571 family LLM class oxidoreductase n=1 Tax=Duganella alba TaxID=2666081 RepID=A0A6L5QJW8_9BURK|nr:LLM class oxidoreductase [Duganella alba]MRX10084.1 TIGR03571 family LLM class oxidoreductase [Duganella alba]MRX16728.1 TIGR03571 family LLM class oxidoreductase [Duganella alba]